MTREIRYPDTNDRRQTPKYIDHGHLGRKAVYWAVVALVLPVAVAQVCAAKFVDLTEHVAHAVSRLQVWSHPCLYAPQPREPAPELSGEWKARARCPEHGSFCPGEACCCKDKHRED